MSDKIMESEQRIQPKHGRASSPGSRNKIKTSAMHDRLIRNIDDPFHEEVIIPSELELLALIRQAQKAVDRIKSQPAIGRLLMLKAMYSHFYG